ncbi:AcrR family transcriptional regulator [Kitasatospora sp. MAP12-15]|uniref:TetR/AcrR family transcriptional regulator n=1 Tax=unclassified Kitasatospora TaxID=2633591 RepID=UPI00247626A6|nr:TetR/AcrR family transcriptional regulator [Kitasatospora sp. MAP12-44]MDH6108895.1 AcrR family transcriptional regulator [Kitasatospora sp. MAP12-44]
MVRGSGSGSGSGSGFAAASVDSEELRERLVLAALRVAGEHGLAELTVQRIAQAAGTSAISVYTRFGGLAGVLEALYRRTFAMLGEAFRAVPRTGGGDPLGHLLALAMAYRSFALAVPPRYAFMFDRPVPDFEPAQPLRAEALQGAFAPLIDAVRELAGTETEGTGTEGTALAGTEPAGVGTADATRTAYLLWCVMHGMVGLELADVLRTPLPGWGIAVPDESAGEQMYRAGVRAMLNGLGHPGTRTP